MFELLGGVWGWLFGRGGRGGEVQWMRGEGGREGEWLESRDEREERKGDPSAGEAPLEKGRKKKRDSALGLEREREREIE